MDEELLSHRERIRKPYVLLLDPSRTRGAAYDHGHRLMHDDASRELIAHGLRHHTLMEPWDDRKDLHFGRQRPSWAPAGSLDGWTLIWLRDSKSTPAWVRATPDR